MKRRHVHVAVDDIDRSIGFYSTLFGTAPSVLKVYRRRDQPCSHYSGRRRLGAGRNRHTQRVL